MDHSARVQDLTSFFYQPASLIAQFLFFLTDHSSSLILSVNHEFLLSIKRFFFLFALICYLFHLLGQLPVISEKKRLLMSKRAMSRFVHLKPKIFIFVTDLKFVTTLLILNHLRTFFKSFFPLWCLFNLADDFTTVF